MNKKYEQLVDDIKRLGRVIIAFSGGVDSTLLIKAAYDALGDNAVAVTIDTPYIPRWELEEAVEIAKDITIQHKIITFNKIPEIIQDNPDQRCYLCKKELFTQIKNLANDLDIKWVIDGSNFDDTKDYRPGMKALKEMRIYSPLLINKWTKVDIRKASKNLGLPTHDKPAYACLLTRIPHDTLITVDELKRIEAAEVYLMSIGFKAVRVRSHGLLARIEVDRKDRHKLLKEDLLDTISNQLKSLGYKYVTLELEGYKMGSLNK